MASSNYFATKLADNSEIKELELLDCPATGIFRKKSHILENIVYIRKVTAYNL